MKRITCGASDFGIRTMAKWLPSGETSHIGSKLVDAQTPPNSATGAPNCGTVPKVTRLTKTESLSRKKISPVLLQRGSTPPRVETGQRAHLVVALRVRAD
jgi:hypothetical protein